jgi:hypothetical protein
MGGEWLLALLAILGVIGAVISALLCLRPSSRPSAISTLVIAAIVGLLMASEVDTILWWRYFLVGAGLAFPFCGLHNLLRRWLASWQVLSAGAKTSTREP